MKYFSLLFFSCQWLTQSLLAQNYITPEYKFLDTFKNADLNYQAIDSINLTAGGITKLDSNFKPIKGKYTIYRFMSYDRGITFDEHVDDINELIILKVDKNNNIIDGYQYVLQMPEMPFSCHLYRISKRIPLNQQIKIADLKFKKIHKKIKGHRECEMVPVDMQDDRYLIFNKK